MAYLTWMADVLRAAGLSVQEVGGWRTRGHGSMSDIRGVLLHHTAGAPTGNYPSLGVVRDGRPGLAGPLAHLGLARDGSWLVIAAGNASHAGLGYVSWCGRDNGNKHLIGVEAESTGRGDWTPAQLASYPRGVAALLRHLGLGADRALAHKEWAPSRKIDPAGWPGGLSGFRATVAGHLRPVPPPAPKSPVDEESTVLCPAGTNEHIVIPAAGRPPWLYVYAAFERFVDCHQIEFLAKTPNRAGGDFSGDRMAVRFEANRPGPIRIPDNTVGVILRYTADHHFTAYVG
jgi:hypothetical protein